MASAWTVRDLRTDGRRGGTHTGKNKRRSGRALLRYRAAIRHQGAQRDKPALFGTASARDGHRGQGYRYPRGFRNWTVCAGERTVFPICGGEQRMVLHARGGDIRPHLSAGKRRDIRVCSAQYAQYCGRRKACAGDCRPIRKELYASGRKRHAARRGQAPADCRRDRDDTGKPWERRGTGAKGKKDYRLQCEKHPYRKTAVRGGRCRACGKCGAWIRHGHFPDKAGQHLYIPWGGGIFKGRSRHKHGKAS